MCKTEEAAAQDAYQSLMQYHGDSYELAESDLAATVNACADLHQHGCSDDIIEDANTDVELLNTLLEEAMFSKRESNASKKAIQKRFNIVNQAVLDEAAFVDFVETFSLSGAENEACEIRAARKDYKYPNAAGTKDIHKYDFVIFYLNGNCAVDQEEEILFKKNAKFWTKAGVYDGPLAELIGESNTERRFKLTAGGQVAAFRVFKKQGFNAKSPRGIVIDDQDA